MLVKKYYDGEQIHRIISEEVKDYDTVMKILKRFADEPSAQPMRKKGKPIFKHGECVAHVSYANGTGGFETHKWADWVCPECGWFVGEQYIPRRHNQQKSNFCSKCGCEIDWTEADMRGEQG